MIPYFTRISPSICFFVSAGSTAIVPSGVES
jgi:hypothetical protein